MLRLQGGFGRERTLMDFASYRRSWNPSASPPAPGGFGDGYAKKMSSALAAIIFAATPIAIVLRPWKISEAWSAGAGATLMVVTGAVNVGSALEAIGTEWNLFLFFLGLMLTAAVADMAGFFDWTAALAAGAAGGSGRRLLFNVFVLGALITTFLSNDATAVILTPVV